MNDTIDNLLARLAAVRAAQPDPNEITMAPGPRERLMERIALLDRFERGTRRRLDRVQVLQDQVEALKSELNKWHRLEARAHAEVVSARARLEALPHSTHHEVRRLAEGAVVVAERMIGWCKVGPVRDCGMVISGQPFDGWYRSEFGTLPHESTALAPPELQSRLDALEPELLEARVSLDREVASLAETLLELERIAA